jgi:Fe-S-cluster containining protein
LKLPRHSKCKHCGNCCGIIPLSPEELQCIRNYIDQHRDIEINAHNDTCPFKNDNKALHCNIYEVRPLICRLMGISNEVRCPYGNSAYINGRATMRGRKLAETIFLNEVDW